MKLNRGSNTMSRGKKRKEKKGEKQTQGFGENGEVGVGKKKRGDLGDRNEFIRNRGGKNIARDIQRNGKRGFWERRKKKKKLIGFRRKNKGKPTCGKDSLAIKEGKIILFD